MWCAVPPPPDADQLITLMGYESQQYNVQTSDGYILTVFRIPTRRHQTIEDNNTPGCSNIDSQQGYCTGPPVLLSHMLGSSCEIFLVNGPENSPALFLANSGYDVWLINLRGNYHSRNHTTFDADADEEFWEFTMDDHIEDYRATVEFIIQMTGYSQVSFLGYDHGATTMMMALSDDPDWFTPRVSVFLALAPMTTMQHATNPMVNNVMNMEFLGSLIDSGVNEISQNSCFNERVPYDTIWRMVVGPVVKVNSFEDDYNDEIDNFQAFNKFLIYFVTGSNLNEYIQYAQMRAASKLN
jgi:pimeloyl-ACP methyl ester carboxylesterase